MCGIRPPLIPRALPWANMDQADGLVSIQFRKTFSGEKKKETLYHEESNQNGKYPSKNLKSALLRKST
jgi:hypothetical protein